MVDLSDLCVLTGMRRGELLELERGEVAEAGNVWRIEKGLHMGAYLGHSRRIILGGAAIVVVSRRLKGLRPEQRLFTIRASAAYTRFCKACRVAGITGLRTHELHHEGLSRMADAGLTLGELQAQSGHRSAQMLMRYMNAKPKDIAAKLG